MIDDKKHAKVYTKDAFVFYGLIKHIDSDFLIIHDYKTDKDITIPIMNVARIEEVKD